MKQNLTILFILIVFCSGAQTRTATKNYSYQQRTDL